MESPSTTTPADDKAASLGVYFFPEDYAGLGRRLLILAVDVVVLGVVFVFCLIAYLLINGIYYQKYGTHLTSLPLLLVCLAVCWTYLALIEGLVGTLGFLCADVKIVNLRGERPSVWRMTFRILFCVPFGLFMPLIDLIWLAGDLDWQSFRDKLAGTLVVRREAIPAGGGPIKLGRILSMGLFLAFFEVGKCNKEAARSAPRPLGGPGQLVTIPTPADTSFRPAGR